MTTARTLALAIVLVTVSANSAPAATVDEPESVAARRSDVAATAARNGSMLFLSQGASVGSRQGLGMAFGGYDGAVNAALFESAAEVTVFGAFALRASAVYSSSSGRLRPSVGGKAQILTAAAHGVDGTVGLFYRPEGLTEPEGEIEGFLALGRSVGANYFVGNLFYGQDPEGNERDGEVRVAWLRSFGDRMLLGLDTRVRFDLGSDPMKLAAHNEATVDLVAGPILGVVIGPIAVLAQTGASSRRTAGATTNGVLAIAGIGTAF